MPPTMMPFQLTLTHILERAGRLFPRAEVASRLPDKSIHRYHYADFCDRTRRLGGALRTLGLKRGDRVATLMWNHYAHLEAYFAVPCAGGVLHTLNLRLAPEDIGYIAAHAKDRFLIVDDVLLPLYEKFKHLAPFEQVVVVPLSGAPVPQGLTSYEALLERARPRAWPALKEDAPAAMCYTSGTTGRPKGVVYTHRSLVLHSLASALPDVLAVSRGDTICPVVPMFHVNAWGLPFTAVMAGAHIAFPGPHLDAANLLDLFVQERVSLTAGVPTIWAGILQAIAAEPTRWALPRDMRMVVGGAAVSESMLRGFDAAGLRLIQGWGMTETSPVAAINGTTSAPGPRGETYDYSQRVKQGVPLPFVEVRVMTPEGEAAWDGTSVGELELRGPWIAAGYHDRPEETDKWTADGWLRTGDVVSIDSRGFIKITDRIKDLVKSGGEWISSVDLENALAGHPKVAEAAVIAVPHPKWGERPLAVVVLEAGQSATADELREHLAPSFSKLWLPDGVEFVSAIPRTSTGKILKTALRERFKDWSTP
jgi:fatty-acyl-CoA synthase